MVKSTQKHSYITENFIDPNAWFNHLATKRKATDLELIRRAISLAQLTGENKATFTGESCLQQGLGIAEILDQLDMDVESICAAILYPALHYAELHLEDISEQLNLRISKLVDGVHKMNAIHILHQQTQQNHTQLDNLRKMLLAMVDDVRVVLLKLAERTFVMRAISKHGSATQKEIAKEIRDIYAPLANRLGMGQIKWELEDLTFRYLEPETYKSIATQLDQKRVDREQFIKIVIETLENSLQEMHIQNYNIEGRAKHIFSIHKKMKRKDVDISQIYDASAVRVLVASIEDCYAVLGLVHSLWQPIPAEYDDYISHPKPNGYRSLHTAVIGPNNRNVEVQIRTTEMHQESELGVAAHWIYKEGGGARSSYDQKIAWLRQLIDWQKELAGDKITLETENKIFEDRVYVFTPNNEIIDLPHGATPLDFAYLIHTDIGHRCRGAKINGNIVPLTYHLKTGDRIEILTAKQANPSRDWLNPNCGYLTTSRAKAKVMHWFKQEDYEKNKHEGHEIILRELRRMKLENVSFEYLAEKLHQKSVDDLLAAVGNGDVRVGQILNAAEELEHKTKEQSHHDLTFDEIKIKREKPRKISTGIQVQGVGNLLITMANCCHPVPGDDIIGYITLMKGVSIHRKDCPNVLSASMSHQEKFIDVSWGESKGFYPVKMFIQAFDRSGLVRDITTILANEKINVLGLSTHTNKSENTAHIHLTIEVPDLNLLSKIFDKINHLPNIIHVEREK